LLAYREQAVVDETGAHEAALIAAGLLEIGDGTRAPARIIIAKSRALSLVSSDFSATNRCARRL
jgi:hypothetical protein